MNLNTNNYLNKKFDIKTNTNINEKMGEDVSQEVGDNLSQEVGENVSQEVGENVSQDVGDNASQEVGEDVSQEVGEDVSQDVGDNASQDVGENVNEDVNEDVREDVGEDVGEEEDIKINKSNDIKLLLKLYRYVLIDKEKLSCNNEHPTTYQWEFARQNIKYIILLLDKLYLYTNQFLFKNSKLISKDNYNIFKIIWINMKKKVADYYEKKQITNLTYNTYNRLFDICYKKSCEFVWIPNKDFSYLYNLYFNELRTLFNKYYDIILESWNDDIVDDIKLNILGNGSLIIDDPSCVKLPNDLIMDIYLEFELYLNKIKNKNKTFQQFILPSGLCTGLYVGLCMGLSTSLYVFNKRYLK